MTPLLLAALLVAQAGDGLTFEPPKDWTRQEDPQKRFSLLTPPKLPAGKECAVLIFAPQEIAVALPQYLDQLVRGAVGANQLLSQVQPSSVGNFQVAVWTQKTPQGVTQYVALHAARWGSRGQSVVYATTDPELFKTHAPDVIAMLNKVVLPGAAARAAVAAGSVVLAGMNVPLPAGWTRKDDPSGWILLLPPPNLQFGKPVVMIAPTRKIEGSHWKAHRELLKSMTEQAKWPGSYMDNQAAGPGPFIMSTAHCSTDARGMKLYTAVAGDQMEAIAISPLGGDELITALHPILEKVTLRNDPPGGPKRPEIVEAYRRVSQKKFVNLDGTTSFGSLKYERMLLLSNGVADFNECYSEGYDAFAGFSKIDPEAENGFYGGWKEDGKSVRIRRDSKGAGEVFERADGGLKSGGQAWTPMPRVEGLKLKGRYSFKSAPVTAAPFNFWIEFTEEGRFKTGGLLTWLAASATETRPRPPETCEGSFELRNWTIWFKVDGKPVWSTDFTTLNDDPKDLSILLINTYSFTKE